MTSLLLLRRLPWRRVCQHLPQATDAIGIRLPPLFPVVVLQAGNLGVTWQAVEHLLQGWPHIGLATVGIQCFRETVAIGVVVAELPQVTFHRCHDWTEVFGCRRETQSSMHHPG